MIRAIATITLLVTLCSPATAQAYPSQVERWRPIVRAELKRQHVWSSFIENKAMHIINGESTGNSSRGSRSGCYGLLQFDRGWIRHSSDWRGNGRTSIRTFVTLYRKHGLSPIRRHWKATYY